MGREEDAVPHFEAALETNERIGAPPWTARTQADLARALIARGGPGDREHARCLLATALATYRELGMQSWETSSNRMIDVLDKP